MIDIDTVQTFFDHYAGALLARDANAVATLYAVPALILFPGQSIAVTDEQQTADFFAASWEQYEGVSAVDRAVTVMGETEHSVWADVTWSYDGRPRERFCYQLLLGESGLQIAVLTPLV